MESRLLLAGILIPAYISFTGQSALGQSDKLECKYAPDPEGVYTCETIPSYGFGIDPRPGDERLRGGIVGLFSVIRCSLTLESGIECSERYYPNNRRCSDIIRERKLLAIYATATKCREAAEKGRLVRPQIPAQHAGQCESPIVTRTQCVLKPISSYASSSSSTSTSYSSSSSSSSTSSSSARYSSSSTSSVSRSSSSSASSLNSRSSSTTSSSSLSALSSSSSLGPTISSGT